ncbi:MAG: aminoacyl-histidine dipeptidase [Rikenellaceae bacterium]
MDKNISQLSPEKVWKHFMAICSIPHPSKHEEAIAKYVVDFAAEHEIECHVDKTGNVLLRKPATEGMEGCKGIIMQGHLDMVAQKNGDKEFDFLKDGIEPYIDGEWLTANGTTLGADNGMGVAAALAVMESTDLVHGDIEALFTIDEETGMTGAFGLEPDFLKGDILMNLDSEDEGELYVGCAGGVDAVCTLPISKEAIAVGSATYNVELKGMKGGHSGMEIILQRGNAIKALARVLNAASKVADIKIADFAGGDVRNAIPRECGSVVVVAASDCQSFETKLAEELDLIIKELKATEEGIELIVSKIDAVAESFDGATTKNLLNLLTAHPNGTIRMSDSLKGLVETSINLGVVKCSEKEVTFISLLRSSSDSSKDYLASQLISIFELAGGVANMVGGYNGWTPNMDSAILKTMQESYKNLYGKTPEIKAIHAGLECGIIGGVYPKMDMISFGPTIRFPHSPDEKVLISSVEKFYNFLVYSLANAPLK